MTLSEALDLLTVPEVKQRRELAGSTDRSTRKSDMIRAIAGTLLTGDLGPLWAQLSELEVSAVAEAVHCWGGRFDPARFRAKYGALPDHFEYDPYRSWLLRKPPPKSVLPLFFYQGEIPEDLCPRLAGLAPRPAELPIETLGDAELPTAVASGDGAEEPLRRVSTEPLALHDLPAVLRLIGQGGVAVGPKTGLPGGAAVARIEAILLGGDWYGPSEDQDLERWGGGPIRPIRPFAWPLLLQCGGLAKLDGVRLALTTRGNKALSQPLAEVLAQLFERWQQKGVPDELRRIDLIKGQTGKGARLTAVAERRVVIAAALKDCPAGHWIAVDELFRQMQARGRHFEVTHNPWGLYLADPKYGALGYEAGEGFHILQARYALAYLFEYLATLGLIDVAYTLPYGARPDYHDVWGTEDLGFLSRYDGLRYIRINPLGAYCLGLVPDYRPAPEARRSLFTPGADLGLTLLREPDPGERLMLERIAKPRSADRWDLDSAALLRHGADGDERGRIRAFIESAAAEPLPEPLTRLLDSVAERATALSDAGPARLIQCRDAALAALLASDPATAGACTRAGERLVCVPEQRLAAFRKGLVRLGLVLPETARG